MLRIVLIILFLGIGFSVFSEEFSHNLKKWQSECLLYLGYGNANLQMYDPQSALENYQRADAFLDKADNSSAIIAFLIAFGQVVAYDRLELRDQCKQSIGSLFLAINDNNEEEEAAESTIETNLNYQERKTAVEFLYSIAALARSIEVRELLFAIVEEIADELFSTFQFTNGSFTGEANWAFDYGQNNFYFEQCKKNSIWKKFKKWCHEAAEWISDAAKIFKGAKDIKDTYNNWGNTNV